MRTGVASRVLASLVLASLVLAAAAAHGAGTPKSLVVCLDGLRADAVTPADMPAVTRLVAERWRPGYRTFATMRAHVVDDAPTLSGPNHVSILTGVAPAQHGVRDNAPPALAAVRQPDYLALLERRDARRTTLKLVAWAPEGLIPSGADETVVAPDAELAARGARAIAGGVDALFVFLDGPDAAGHEAGFESDAYRRAVADADAAVGRLLDAIAARPGVDEEDWQIVVTTDHGGTGRSHGGTTVAETTIPFVVASRHAETAPADGVRDLDVAPTVLAHFGIDPRAPVELRPGGPTYLLDGVARVPVTPR